MKLGSSDINQKSKLKTTAPNNQWFKNVIKSIGISTADIIKETLPSTFDFVETNTEPIMDLYQQLRQESPKSYSKLLAQAVEKNEYMKIAKDTIGYAIEDLKSGKLNNKDREHQSVTGEDDEFSLDGDFDFNDEDFNFDNDFDDDFDPDKDDSDSGDTQVTNVKKVTVNNINANISKNNPMVQSLDRQTEAMVDIAEADRKTQVGLATTSFSMNSKIASDMMTGLTSVNDNLSALVDFNNNSMAKYVAASLQYYEDSLNIMKEHLAVVKPPEQEQKERGEQDDVFSSYGGLDFTKYVANIKKNLMTTIENDLWLNQIYSFATDKDVIRMSLSNPLGFIPKALAKIVIPVAMQQTMTQFDESFSAFFPALMQRFNYMASSSDSNYIQKIIGSIFGYKNKAESTVRLDEYQKGKMDFNGYTQKAITEVIPTYLRKILSAVSGGEEMVFDYRSGQFMEYIKARQLHEEETRSAVLNSADSYKEIKRRLGMIELTSEKEKREFEKDFDNFMYQYLLKDGLERHHVYTKRKSEDEIDEFQYNSQYTDLYRDFIKALPTHLQMGLGRDKFAARDALTRKTMEARQNIGDSTYATTHAWDTKSEYMQDKNGNYIRRDKEFSFSKDKYGNSTFDYLRSIQKILLQGLVVFPNGSNIVSSGSGTPTSNYYRNRHNNSSQNIPMDYSSVLSQRTSDLEKFKSEEEKKEKEDTKATVDTVKEYSDKEKERLRGKGKIVADSVDEVLISKTSEEIRDAAKNYIAILDMDEEEEKMNKSVGGWFKKLISKNKGIQSATSLFETIMATPARVVSNVLTQVDAGLYKIIFGVYPDENPQSFVSRVMQSITDSFGKFHEWTKEHFFDPIHKALFGEDGFFTKMKESVLGDKMREFGNKMADWAFGEKDSNGNRKNGLMSDVYNEVKDGVKATMQVITGRGYIDSNGVRHEAEGESMFGHVNKITSDIFKDLKAYMFGTEGPDKIRNGPQSKEEFLDKANAYGEELFDLLDKLTSEKEELEKKQNSGQMSQEEMETMADLQESITNLNEEMRNLAIAIVNVADLNLDFKTQMTEEEFKAIKNFKPKLPKPETTAEENNQQSTDTSTDGNGGENLFEKAFNWMKDNVKLQYQITTDDYQSSPKTISVGEDINDSVGGGGLAPTMVNGFPYFSQKDPRYANVQYNLSAGKGNGDSLAFADRGCGPTAFAMVANGMGNNVDPIDMANMATDSGYSVEGGTKGSFFSDAGSSLGMNVKEKQTDVSQVNSALRDGKPIIFRGRKTTDNITPFTNEGHFVVGHKGSNGKIQINDPNGIETSGEYDIKDIVSESNKMWTFDNSDTAQGGDTGKGDEDKQEPRKTRKKLSKKSIKKLSRKILVKAEEERRARVDKYWARKEQIQDEAEARLNDRLRTNWTKDVDSTYAGEIKGVVNEVKDGIRETSKKWTRLLFGKEEASDEEVQQIQKKFMIDFKKAIPRTLAGGLGGAVVGSTLLASTGVLGSLFLPGGPVGGAILGSAVGFLSTSNKFKEWMFGKMDEKTQKRVGGLISQSTQDFFKKNKKLIVAGGIIGAVKGAMLSNMGVGLFGSMLLGGPLTGALMGAATAVVLKSEKFKDMMFGKMDHNVGKRVNGLFSKSYNAVTKNKALIGGGILGAGAGAAIGLIGSQFGILGSALFMGPVGGALVGAGIGIAAASDRFTDAIFGKKDAYSGIREGGLFKGVKDGLINIVLLPMKQAGENLFNDLRYWFFKSIIGPISRFFEPVGTLLKQTFNRVVNKMEDISIWFKDFFNDLIAQPAKNFMKKFIFDPLKGIFKGLFKGFMGIAKFIGGAPFRLADNLISKRAAKKVEKNAEKFNKRHTRAREKAMELMAEREENGGILTYIDERKLEKFTREMDRYDSYSNENRANNKEFTMFSNWKEHRDETNAELKKERNTKRAELKKKHEDEKKRRQFIKYFGHDMEYDEEALNRYVNMMMKTNWRGKKVMTSGREYAKRKKYADFFANEVKDQYYNNNKSKVTEESVKDINKLLKKDIKNNISGIHGTLIGIFERLKWMKPKEEEIDKKIKEQKEKIPQVKQSEAEKKATKAESNRDFFFEQYKANGYKNPTNYQNVDQRDEAERRKEEEEANKAQQQSQDNDQEQVASGGSTYRRKDNPWSNTFGKGDEERIFVEDGSISIRRDRENLYHGFKGAYFGLKGAQAALKKTSSVLSKGKEKIANMFTKQDAEELQIAQEERQAKLSAKQKAQEGQAKVSMRNYKNIAMEKARAWKEETELQWRKDLLEAVKRNENVTTSFKDLWGTIFSKKGLITAALIAGLPILLKVGKGLWDFLKNPMQVIGDAIKNVVSNIKIGISWLFGKDNNKRTDENGDPITNTGLVDDTVRYGVQYAPKVVRALKGGVKKYGGEIVDGAKKGIKYVRNTPNRLRKWKTDVDVKSRRFSNALNGRDLDDGVVDILSRGKNHNSGANILKDDELFRVYDDGTYYNKKTNTFYDGKYKPNKAKTVIHGDDIVDSSFINNLNSDYSKRGMVTSNPDIADLHNDLWKLDANLGGSSVLKDTDQFTVYSDGSVYNKKSKKFTTRSHLDTHSLDLGDTKFKKLDKMPSHSVDFYDNMNIVDSNDFFDVYENGSVKDKRNGKFFQKIFDDMADEAVESFDDVGEVLTNSKRKGFKKFIDLSKSFIDWLFNTKAMQKIFKAKDLLISCKDNIMRRVMSALGNNKIIMKFSAAISETVAKVTGRTGTTIFTAGFSKVVFGVIDITSGAVDAERLFQIPKGSADMLMRTISAAITAICGAIDLWGPVADLLNTIVFEITGFSMFTTIAVMIYDLLSSGENELKLDSLQADFDDQYEQYKAEHGLEDLSKAAYIDLTNKAFGSKVVDGVKDGFNAVTGNFFSANNIRETMGKGEDEKVTFGDRFNMFANTFKSNITGIDYTSSMNDNTIRQALGLEEGTEITKDIRKQYNQKLKSDHKAQKEADKRSVLGLEDSDRKLNILDNLEYELRTGGFSKAGSAELLGKDVDALTISDRIATGISEGINMSPIGSILKQFGINESQLANGMSKVTDSVAWAGGKVVDGLSWASNKIEDGARGIGNFLVGGEDNVRSRLGLNENVELNFTDYLSTFGGNIASLFGKDATETTQYLKGKMLTLKDNVSKAMDLFGEKSKEGMAKLFGLNYKKEDPNNPGFDLDGNELVSLKTQFKNKAYDLWNGVKDRASELGQTLRDCGSIWVKSTKKGLMSFFGLKYQEEDPNNPGFDENGDAILTVRQQLGQKLNDAWTSISGTVGGWFEDFKESETGKALKRVKDDFYKLFGFVDENGEPISITAEAGKTIKYLATFIKDYFIHLKDKVVGAVQDAKKWITEELLPKYLNPSYWIGKMLGLKDENGNTVSVGNYIKGVEPSSAQLYEQQLAQERSRKESEKRNAEAAANNTGNGGFGDGSSLPTTVGARGCGPTAMAMVASKMTGKSVDPVSMSQLATQSGYVDQTGTRGEYFNYAANTLGIKSQQSHTTKSKLVNALDSGQPVILRGDSNGDPNSAFTRAGHYVVATKSSGDKVTINDPRGEVYSGDYDINDVVNQSNIMWKFGSNTTNKHRYSGKNGGFGPEDEAAGAINTSRWIETVKACKAAIAAQKPGYSQSNYISITIGGVTKKVRTDCTGLIMACLKFYGVMEDSVNVNSNSMLSSSGPMAKTGFRYRKFTSWEDLQPGDIVVKSGHAEIFAGIVDGKPKVYNAGWHDSINNPGMTAASNPSYTCVWSPTGPGSSAVNLTGGTTTLNTNNSTGTSTNNGPFGALTNIGNFLNNTFSTALMGSLNGDENVTFQTFDEYLASQQTSSNDSSSSSTSSSSGSSSSAVQFLDTPNGKAAKENFMNGVVTNLYEEVVQKTFERTVAGEGQYDSVDDGLNGDYYSVGMFQFHGDKTKKYFDELAKRLPKYSAEANKWGSLWNRKISKSQVADLQSFLRNPEVKAVAEPLQREQGYEHLVGNISSPLAMFKNEELLDPRSIVLSADIGNTGPAHLKTWRSKYRKGAYSSEELNNVSQSLQRDSWWGTTGKTFKGGLYYNGWMNRIKKSEKELGNWTPKFASQGKDGGFGGDTGDIEMIPESKSCSENALENIVLDNFSKVEKNDGGFGDVPLVDIKPDLNRIRTVDRYINSTPVTVENHYQDNDKVCDISQAMLEVLKIIATNTSTTGLDIKDALSTAISKISTSNNVNINNISTNNKIMNERSQRSSNIDYQNLSIAQKIASGRFV